MHGYVCQLELRALASHTLTEVTLRKMFCTTQEHMNMTQMYKTVRTQTGVDHKQKPGNTISSTKRYTEAALESMGHCELQ